VAGCGWGESRALWLQLYLHTLWNQTPEYAQPTNQPCTVPSAEAWTTLATGAFRAAYGFAYVCSVLFMIFTLVLLVFQKAVTRELGELLGPRAGRRRWWRWRTAAAQ
jgi:hypothetical protein